jgi:UDP-sugar transporter A1/2/3
LQTRAHNMLCDTTAGTYSQRTLQTYHRSAHVFNMELATFSVTFLSLSLAAGSPDCQKIKENGAGQGWTLKTCVPILSSGIGGILVGLVTKYQGAVVKSFAMIFGMVISGILQQLILAKEGGGVTREQLAGATFGAMSLYLHASYPP